MTLYQQLKASSNPQAPVQVALTLLASHSVREVARILGVSPRWVYTLRKRYREGGKRGPKNPMPNRTPQHLEELVVTMAQEALCGPGSGPWSLSPSLHHSEHPQASLHTVQEVPDREWGKEVWGAPLCFPAS
ncbi:MAG: helix-turn-helix domain-containing protein [Candidatus Methanomethylicaceae archaeon]